MASRGLDIPSVDLVINFDIPSNPKDYIHRVGRTARAGKQGRAISMVTQYDIETLQKTEASIGKQLVEFGKKEGEIFDSKIALELTDSVVEANRIATMELKQMEQTKGKGVNDDEPDDEENNVDMKLFGKKRKGNQMHGKGFGSKSFAKKK